MCNFTCIVVSRLGILYCEELITIAINYKTHSNLSIVIPNELKEELQALAKEDRRSMSAQVVYIIEQYLKERAD